MISLNSRNLVKSRLNLPELAIDSTPGNVAGIVSANHDRPHVAVITAAQLAAAAPILIEISNGLHSHTVSLTGAQVGEIAAGTRVAVASSVNPHSNGTDPHSHMVTFN